MNQYILPVSAKTKVLNLFRKVFRISVFEQWLLSRTIHKPATDFFVKLIPPNYSYPVNTIRHAIRDGIKYNLDLSEYVEHSIYWGIKDEGHDTLYKHIKPGMIVFDIGGNIGDTALHFSRTVGIEGMVFVFEPDPLNFKKLQENLSLNNCTNVQTFMLGIGSSPSVMKLYKVDPGNKGRNRMFLNKSEDVDFTEVKIEKLDAVLTDINCSKIDFIKIDVEGFEFEVLKGAIGCLDKFKPTLFIELNDSILKVNNSSAKELTDFLFDRGYKITIAQSGQPVASGKINFEKMHCDILCEYNSL